MANDPHAGCTGLYLSVVVDGNLRLPLTSFFSPVLRFYKVGFWKIHPLCVLRIVSFEIVVVSLGKTPTVNIFRYFFKV